MSTRPKNKASKLFFLTVLVATACVFSLSGCKEANKLSTEVTGPQMVVNPDTIRLGVAHVTGTDIVFEGSGFQPDDSIFISLMGPDDATVVLADSSINPDGTFTAKVSPLAKVTGILKANITGKYAADGKYDQILVITNDPIPAGVYTAVARGMLSDQSAEVKFTVSKPSTIDSLKDWLGKKMGKIQDKKE